MKKLFVLTVLAGLAAFQVGCSDSSAPSGDAKLPTPGSGPSPMMGAPGQGTNAKKDDAKKDGDKPEGDAAATDGDKPDGDAAPDKEKEGE